MTNKNEFRVESARGAPHVTMLRDILHATLFAAFACGVVDSLAGHPFARVDFLVAFVVLGALFGIDLGESRRFK